MSKPDSKIEKARAAFLDARAFIRDNPESREPKGSPKRGAIKRAAVLALQAAITAYTNAVLASSDPCACAEHEAAELRRASRDPLVHDQGHALMVKAKAKAAA